MNYTGLDRKELMKIYELVISEERFFISEHHRKLAFYAGFISSMFAGVIAMIFRANNLYHFLLLFWAVLFGIIPACVAGYISSKNAYRRFLEAITMKAKLERVLGLENKINNVEEGNWMSNEQLISSRHLESRQDTDIKTSNEWVKEKLKTLKSVHGSSKFFFWVFRTFCIIGGYKPCL